jgi:predicted neutral ceramidase superfamily lipid hydrolase
MIDCMNNQKEKRDKNEEKKAFKRKLKVAKKRNQSNTEKLQKNGQLW